MGGLIGSGRCGKTEREPVERSRVIAPFTRARGLPIVTTTGGAAAQTVPDAAALKIPPADVAALREALRRLMREDDFRRRLGGRVMARRTGSAAMARFRPPRRRGVLGDGEGLNFRRRADGWPRFLAEAKTVEKQSR
jgi:glycosyltransferase involved in cell wall biosynthesis